MSTYSGNQYGYKKLFVFDSNSGTTANFVTTIDAASNTGAYVSAGGFTLSTDEELYQYIGNSAYLAYKRKTKKIISTLGSGGEGITSTIIEYTPDPRSIIGIFASGSSASITGTHMDEIHITENTGNTFQAFLGKITYIEEDNTIPTGSCLLDLIAYGLSGSDDPYPLFYYSIGSTLENKTNGITATIKNTAYRNYVDIASYRSKIKQQVGISLDATGITSATIGSQNVYFPVNSKELFDYTSALLPAFAHGGSGADDRVKQTHVFTLLAGTTGSIGSNIIYQYGVTFDGLSGGTLGYNSEFEEFAHYVIHTKVGFENNKGGILYAIQNKNSIRGIDQVSF